MSEEKRFGGYAADLIHDGFKGFMKLWKIRGNNHVVVEKKNVVAILIYNGDRRAVAMVRQKREAVANNEDPNGWICEVPAGHIEEDDPSYPYPDYAAVREAREELGLVIDYDYSFTGSDFTYKPNGYYSLFTSPGIMTEQVWLVYAEFNDANFDQSKTWFGVAEEGESTERVWLPIDDLAEMSFSDLKTFSLVQWFLRVKYPQLAKQKEGV